MAHGQERLKVKIGDEPLPIKPMRNVGMDARPFMKSSTLPA
jgi:hypothetical protein